VTRKQRKGGPSLTKEDPRVHPPPESKGQVWDCHLLIASTSDGTPFEIMPLVDERSKECLATLVERNISAQDVTDCLFDLFVLRGTPECIRSNNGAGSMAKAIDDWLRQSGVETHSVQGKARRNNGAGSLSGKLKDELIDKTTFTTLPEAKAAIEGWREVHNKTLLRHPIPTKEHCESPRLQPSTSDDTAGIQFPRRDPPADQLEPEQAPGLPSSTPLGPKAPESIASLDSPDIEVSGSQCVPQGASPPGHIDHREAQGLPGSIRRGSTTPESIASLDSPDTEVGESQCVPQGASPPGHIDHREAQGLPGSIRRGSTTPESIPYLRSPVTEEEGRSIQSQVYVSNPASAHGTGLESRLASGDRVLVAQSLKPTFFPRHPLRKTVSGARMTVVRLAEWVVVATPILVVALVALILVAPYSGWRVDTVRSGSMEPGLKVGSVVLTQPVEAKEINVGDVITFRSPTSGEITSRRVSAIEEGSSFRTEGIANGNADPFITPAQSVVGRVWLHVPFVGYVIQYLMTPMCLLLLFVFGLSIVVAGLASSILRLRRTTPA
jgi:signal peptidase I